MCLSIYVLFKYKKWLHNNYSYTKNISLQWIYIPIISFVVFWFVWFIIRLTDILFFSGKYSDVYYYPMYIILSVIALWIGFKGYVNSTNGTIGFVVNKPVINVTLETIWGNLGYNQKNLNQAKEDIVTHT